MLLADVLDVLFQGPVRFLAINRHVSHVTIAMHATIIYKSSTNVILGCTSGALKVSLFLGHGQTWKLTLVVPTIDSIFGIRTVRMYDGCHLDIMPGIPGPYLT